MIQSEKLKAHAKRLRLYNIAKPHGQHSASCTGRKTDLPGIPVPGIRHRS